MSYALFVTLGIVAGFVLGRFVPSDERTPPDVARATRFAALAFGVPGAYLAEFPAAYLDLSPATGHGVFGGHTVLGGLLFGWLGVELTKLRLGYRASTGDRFALPLSVALCFGRFGCLASGCCVGSGVDPRSLAGRVGLFLDGHARFPASLVEAYFHSTSALALVVAARTGALRGLRFPLYLASYAAVRFALEFRRASPTLAIGLSYYQLLALALFVLAAGTSVARVASRSRPDSAIHDERAALDEQRAEDAAVTAPLVLAATPDREVTRPREGGE